MILSDEEVTAIRKSLPAVCTHQEVIRATESAILDKLKAQEPYAIEVSEDNGGSYKLAYPAAVTKYKMFSPDPVTRLLYTNPIPADDVVRQRDELLVAAEAIEIDAEECLDFDECTAMLVPFDFSTETLESEGSASVKGETK